MANLSISKQPLRRRLKLTATAAISCNLLVINVYIIITIIYRTVVGTILASAVLYLQPISYFPLLLLFNFYLWTCLNINFFISSLLYTTFSCQFSAFIHKFQRFSVIIAKYPAQKNPPNIIPPSLAILLLISPSDTGYYKRNYFV